MKIMALEVHLFQQNNRILTIHIHLRSTEAWDRDNFMTIDSEDENRASAAPGRPGIAREFDIFFCFARK